MSATRSRSGSVPDAEPVEALHGVVGGRAGVGGLVRLVVVSRRSSSAGNPTTSAKSAVAEVVAAGTRADGVDDRAADVRGGEGGEGNPVRRVVPLGCLRERQVAVRDEVLLLERSMTPAPCFAAWADRVLARRASVRSCASCASWVGGRGDRSGVHTRGSTLPLGDLVALHGGHAWRRRRAGNGSSGP